MPRYAAFLRAVNVGGRVVRMEQLRDILTARGLRDVETLIASGNVMFESAARGAARLERDIEEWLHAALGYEVTSFVRSAAEIAVVADYNPFPGEDPQAPAALYLAFARNAIAADAERRLAQRTTDTDAFRVRGREVYWLCRTRFSDSTFSGPLLERTLGQPATVRKVTTVRRMAARLG